MFFSSGNLKRIKTSQVIKFSVHEFDLGMYNNILNETMYIEKNFKLNKVSYH